MKRDVESAREWRVLLITDTPELERDIREHLLGIHIILDVIPSHAAAAEVFRSSSDLILLHEPNDGSGPETVNFILHESPDSLIVYVSESKDFVMMREVQRSGAVDVVIVPDETTMIGDVVRRVLRIKQESEMDSVATGRKVSSSMRAKGQVISFYSAKGGVGKSLLASTLAQTLQLDYPLSVLLIDLNLQYGAVDSYLGINSNRSICDLIPVIGELNEGYLRNVMVRVNSSQLDVLVSPSDAEKSEWIQPEHVQKLLRVARRYYDYIILDLPSHMDENTHMAIVESDKIVYVLTPEMPSLKAYRQSLDLFRKLSIDIGSSHLSVVFNMIHTKHELSVKDLTKKKEIHTLGVIQEDWKHIQNPINLSVPLRQAPNEKRISTFAKQIRSLAKTFVSNSQVEFALEDKDQDQKKTKKSKLLPRFTVDHTNSDHVNM